MKTTIIILVVLAAAVVGVLALGSGGDDQTFEAASVWKVSKQNLTISVIEGGTLQAADPFEVKSGIDGSAQVIKLAEEGSYVEAGDLLVELDASELEDDLNRQEIAFAQAEAAKLDAELSMEIQASLNKSNIDKAWLQVELARLDIKKYEEADHGQEVKAVENDITIADAEEKRARGRHRRKR